MLSCHTGLINCFCPFHQIASMLRPLDIPSSVPALTNLPGLFGKYYSRSGSTKQELRGNALNEFLIKKDGKAWNDVTEPRANLSEIDPNAIEAFKKGAGMSKRLPFIENENDITRFLEHLLLTEYGNQKRSAILLFGKNRE